MSNTDKPVWPAAATFPFTPFAMPGAGSPTASAGSPPSMGLAGGVDLLKTFWGSLPGSSQVPGFLVPTLDVDELDRRIADLRAAQSWVEVNLNLLRATIQGLEVQRQTIAALQSMATTSSPLTTGGAFDWTSLAASSAPAAVPDAAEPTAAAHAGTPSAAPDATPPSVGPELAASTWLGYLQDQFAKVAQAALAGAGVAAGQPAGAGREDEAVEPPATGRRAPAESAPKRRRTTPKARKPAASPK